jgi:hypothetical protein
MLSVHWKTLPTVWKFSGALAVITIGFVAAFNMFQLWDFTDQYAKGNIVTYMDTTEGGPLYHEGLRLATTDVRLPDEDASPLFKMIQFVFYNPVHFLKSCFYKIWYLISFTRPYFSTMHNALSIVWVGVIYFLYALGWRRASNMPIKIFTIAVILSNCVLVGISTVDWDNRFYIPMESSLVLLAGGGAASLYDRARARLNRG